MALEFEDKAQILRRPGSIRRLVIVTCHDCQTVREFPGDTPYVVILEHLLTWHWKNFKVEEWHCKECVRSRRNDNSATV